MWADGGAQGHLRQQFERGGHLLVTQGQWSLSVHSPVLTRAVPLGCCPGWQARGAGRCVPPGGGRRQDGCAARGGGREARVPAGQELLRKEGDSTSGPPPGQAHSRPFGVKRCFAAEVCPLGRAGLGFPQCGWGWDRPGTSGGFFLSLAAVTIDHLAGGTGPQVTACGGRGLGTLTPLHRAKAVPDTFHHQSPSVPQPGEGPLGPPLYRSG